VECCPTSTELWIALARLGKQKIFITFLKHDFSTGIPYSKSQYLNNLNSHFISESYENARRVLNKVGTFHY
jgi:hypothetical protein